MKYHGKMPAVLGLVITDENNQILEFEEKPANPRSNKASMGIYIFNWEVLKEALETLSEQPGCDFGMHVIPYCHQRGDQILAYNYQGYWKDVRNTFRIFGKRTWN